MKGINVSLDAFEGPMDLLLHLIAKHKIDIYDIPIAKLTDQYMAYIGDAPVESMDRLSEFLVMAATLLEIKSKTLLPPLPKDSGEDAEDPKEALVNRLIEYKRFRGVVAQLKNRQARAERFVTRGPDGVLVEMQKRQPPQDLNYLLGDLTADRLFKMFIDSIMRRELKTDAIRAGFATVYKDVYTIEDKIDRILEALCRAKGLGFTELFDADASKDEVVVTFLAVLELVKLNRISVKQDRVFDRISITRGPLE